MPTYTFKLSNGGSGVEDDTGLSLPNAESAFDYAHGVVRELMMHREQQTRDWQLDVYEDGTKVFSIPFATVPAEFGMRGEQGTLTRAGSSFPNSATAASPKE
jgi:hypothetical protein